MGVAGIDVAPGVDDRDHRLSHVIGAVIAHLRRARAMAERAQIVDPIPAMTAKVFRPLQRHGRSSFPRFAANESWPGLSRPSTCFGASAPRSEQQGHKDLKLRAYA